MKNRVLILALALVCAAKPLFAQEKHPTDADIKTILQTWVDKRKGSPAIVVGIVDRDGPKIFSHGKFTADATNQLGGDTVFEIGSITKAFTGGLLAIAVQRGDLDLDDAAQKFLPASVKLLTRDDKQITLRHLTTHTSGLPRLPGNFKPSDPQNPYADFSVEQMYEFLAKCKLNCVPGEKYDYSNLGAGLLGHILALKAGTNYEALVWREICTPLKMSDTRVTLTPEMKARFAPGHNANGNRVKNWDIPTLAGAGALRSTANDMLKFLAANAGLTETSLRAALEKSHISRHDAGQPGLEIGLGWHIKVESDARFIWHNGGTGGYRAFAGFDRKKLRGVVVLVNSTNDPDEIGMHLLHEWQVAKIDLRVYEEYVGRYKFPIRGQFVITRDGDRLFAKLEEQSPVELLPLSETNFFSTLVNAQISFVKDTNGSVSHLILHQLDLNQKAKRVNP